MDAGNDVGAGGDAAGVLLEGAGRLLGEALLVGAGLRVPPLLKGTLMIWPILSAVGEAPGLAL